MCFDDGVKMTFDSVISNKISMVWKNKSWVIWGRWNRRKVNTSLKVFLLHLDFCR